MRHRVPAFLFLLIALVGGAPLVGQAAARDSGDAIDAAIAGWQAAVGDKLPARRAALDRLAALDDPRVTAILVQALHDVAEERHVVAIADAIGRRAREGALEPLLAELRRSGAGANARRAIAAAIARQGNRGIDELLDLTRTDPDHIDDAVRLAAAQGLAAVRDERAWRGLAPLTLRGSQASRLAILRLLEPARDVAAVTQARLRLLLDTDLVIAATAWRQLAGEGHARARPAFDDLLERLGPSPDDVARAEVIKGLGAGIWADAYEPFLRLSAAEAPVVQTALRMVAGALATDAAFVRWLVTAGVDAAEAGMRRAAFAVIAKASPETVQPLLDRVRAAMQHPGKESLELALALGDLLARDASWPDDVRRLLLANDPQLRTAGFALLFDLGDGGAVEQAQKCLDARAWELRSVAYRYLTRFRVLTSIPLLIVRVGKEEGRLDVELNNALFAHTGTRCWSRADWEAWWKKHQADHQLPAAATIVNAARQGTGGTVTYYGIPLTSKRTIFLIDISGSMLQKIGTDRKRTRLAEAKRQLRMVVEQLPADQRFNVMAYEGTVKPMWPGMHAASPPDKQHVLAEIDVLTTGQGGTNIHDALELAFADKEVDTIYLLTDGEPTVGKLVDPGDIADQVRRWNYARQIVVNCIALGEDSKLLKRLAAESGGQYVLAR